MDFAIALSDGDADLDGILALQRANLEATVGADEATREGFVTIRHTREILAAMHAHGPSVVARADGRVVGYALVLAPEAPPPLPIVESLLATIATLPLDGARWYVMGQVCVAKDWRGRGVFDALYRAHHAFAGRWDLCITEVALRNQRSLRAHRRVGFTTLHEYRDATDAWAIIGLRLQGTQRS